MFGVKRGEIAAVVGASGPGKTTTLRGVAGVMFSRKGGIRFDGVDVTRLPSHERLLKGIELVPEGRRVFPALTVRENLEMGAFKYKRDKSKVASLIEKAMQMFPRLRERAAQRAGTLSGGEQQMLAVSRALVSEARLLCIVGRSLGARA